MNISEIVIAHLSIGPQPVHYYLGVSRKKNNRAHQDRHFVVHQEDHDKHNVLSDSVNIDLTFGPVHEHHSKYNNIYIISIPRLNKVLIKY